QCIAMARGSPPLPARPRDDLDAVAVSTGFETATASRSSGGRRIAAVGRSGRPGRSYTGPMANPPASPTLYLVVSGALAPEGVPELVELLQDDGWKIAVLSTPDGTRFHRPDRLAELTGEQV